MMRNMQDSLATWFQRHARVLPWRQSPDSYRVWISEVMLQQTQVDRVVGYFQAFMERFPCVADLAHADEEDVMQRWAGLGYYRRARQLHAAAKIIAASGFPDDVASWRALPGIGPYTAGAIVSLALNQPVPLVDVNVVRVVSRLMAKHLSLNEVWDQAGIWILEVWGKGIEPRIWNQALMELGALICTSNPQCERCPVQAFCAAMQNQTQLIYPAPAKKKIWKDVAEIVYCLVDDDGNVVVEKASQWRRGLWDLPQDIDVQRERLLYTCTTKHTVTRHRIIRITKVYRYQGAIPEAMKRVPLQACLDGSLAAGSALRKVAGMLFKEKALFGLQ